jgi:hypothetical protein
MNGVTGEKVGGEQQASLDLIFTIIFQMALPLWERYEGAVPSDELRKLEEGGDWPRGLAAAAMNRLNRDKNLRAQLRAFCERERSNWESRQNQGEHR